MVNNTPTTESNAAYQVIMHKGRQTEPVGPVFNQLSQAVSFQDQCLRFAGEGVGQRNHSDRRYSIRVLEINPSLDCT